MTSIERIGSMTRYTVKPKTVYESNFDIGMSVYRITYICPSCDTRFNNENRKAKYCSECGVKFDWSEEVTEL